MNTKTLTIVFIILALIVVAYVFWPKSVAEELPNNHQPMTDTSADVNNNMNHLITLKTNHGDIQFTTYDADAPKTVANFIKLAEDGFYDGVIFHRVIDGFMIQGGDPTGTGTGGPGYTFADELNPTTESYQVGYRKGVVAMANAGPNTNGSQFFILVADYPLPNDYTIFGRVISGQEVADAIAKVQTGANDRPLEDVVIESVAVEKANN
ncbi:MAG: peptidylprolyl isomerase [Candidatus Paceibacterota bacterium]